MTAVKSLHPLAWPMLAWLIDAGRGRVLKKAPRGLERRASLDKMKRKCTHGLEVPWGT